MERVRIARAHGPRAVQLIDTFADHTDVLLLAIIRVKGDKILDLPYCKLLHMARNLCLSLLIFPCESSVSPQMMSGLSKNTRVETLSRRCTIDRPWRRIPLPCTCMSTHV